MSKHQKNHHFREVEYKLDAPDGTRLKKVGAYVLTDSHYDTSHGPLPSVLKDFEGLGYHAHGQTDWRTKTYFDNFDLTGHAKGIEIRVEKKGDHNYKMVVKIGDNKPKSGRFLRDEYPVEDMETLEPELDRLPEHVQEILCRAYHVKHVEKIELWPLERLHSERLRVKYHPGGNQKSIIEYAHDAGRGETATGDTWDFYQAEPERKQGPARLLIAEVNRLRRHFPFLKPAHESKPAPGFAILREKFKDEAFRAFARRHMHHDRFAVLPAYTPPKPKH